ncbi:hypothetical protein AB0K49_16105 [Streptomyces decoyicus]|uniref:hypothetical protein n=1 Tax=Streptomyces decoyicus TaxID=249567 RepID=UPI00345CC365
MLDALPLSRKQLRSVVQASARINLWHGAVRSGKTIASLLAWLLAVAEAPPSGLILVVGRSLQTIERNVFEPLADPALFGPVAAQVRHTRGATTATVLGRTGHLIGAADARAEGRLRGLTASLAYVDEATLLPEGFWVQLLARLSVPGARLLATTNMPPRHPFTDRPRPVRHHRNGALISTLIGGRGPMRKAIDRASGNGRKSSIPAGPVESAPWSALSGEAEYRAALAEAFAGVELGEYDRRIIEWVAGWDSPTVATLASLVIRARKAGGAL